VSLFGAIVQKGTSSEMDVVSSPALKAPHASMEVCSDLMDDWTVKEDQLLNVGGQLAVHEKAGEEEVEEVSLTDLLMTSVNEGLEDAVKCGAAEANFGAEAKTLAKDMLELVEEAKNAPIRRKIEALRAEKEARLEVEKLQREEKEMLKRKREGEEGAMAEGERAPAPDKWGGKLRLLLQSHDTTDQVLVRMEDIKPISGTRELTLRALAIHILQSGIAGPHAGAISAAPCLLHLTDQCLLHPTAPCLLHPTALRHTALCSAVGLDPSSPQLDQLDPGTMVPVRVEFTLGKEIIHAHLARAATYPLTQIYEAQRAEGVLNKQLTMMTRLPSDITSVGPVEELQFEIPEPGEPTALRLTPLHTNTLHPTTLHSNGHHLAALHSNGRHLAALRTTAVAALPSALWLIARCLAEYESPAPKPPASVVRANRPGIPGGGNQTLEGGDGGLHGSPSKKLKAAEVRGAEVRPVGKMYRLTTVHRTNSWATTTNTPCSRCLSKNKPNCSPMRMSSDPIRSQTKTLARTTDHTRTHSLQLRDLKIKLSLVTRTLNGIHDPIKLICIKPLCTHIATEKVLRDKNHKGDVREEPKRCCAAKNQKGVPRLVRGGPSTNKRSVVANLNKQHGRT
jgi:hypothetical protein